MVSINRYEAQNRITNILSEYLSMLKEAEPNKKQLTLETNKLFCNSEKLATILKNNELSTNLYPLLSLDGIKQLYNSCIELARCYELSSYRKYKDACIEYKNIFKIGSSLNSFTAEDSALKVEEGRCVVFKLEQLNDYILQSGENIYYTVEWKKTDSSGKNTSGIINNLIKNNFDDDSRDREFSFDKAGKYKIHADYVQRLYGRSEYRKVIEHNEITVFVVPGDEKIKNMKLQDKYIYAIRYADWDEAICDAKTMAIMLSATALIFGLIALTPIDELMVVMAPIFQAIGIGGAIEEFIKSLYLIADFIDRVNKAQSEAALQEAGDVFAQIIVGLGIAGLSALLNYLSGKAGAKAKERLKANTAEIKNPKKAIGENIKDIKSTNNYDEIVQKSGSKGNWNKVLNNKLEPNKVYKVDTYNYHTDSIGRVDNVSGNLKLEPKGRNLYQQGKAVKLKNGLKGEDEGGHIIAQIFNGPGEQINYVPQTQTLNRGDWKVMENEWKEALSKIPPDEVKVDIQIIYDRNNKRPKRFNVKSIITNYEGKKQIKKYKFYN